jgi:hypothetical protein
VPITVDCERVLGTMMDRSLLFTHHADLMLSRMALGTKRVGTVSPFLHPRQSRSLWLSVASTALYCSEVWMDQMGSKNWERLESAHALGVKRAARMSPKSCNNDALYEMGIWPLKHMAKEKAYRQSAQRSSHPHAASMAVFRGRFESMTRVEKVMPHVLPASPMDPACDKIYFLVEPPSAVRASEAEEIRRESNNKQHMKAVAMIPEGHFMM